MGYLVLPELCSALTCCPRSGRRPGRFWCSSGCIGPGGGPAGARRRASRHPRPARARVRQPEVSESTLSEATANLEAARDAVAGGPKRALAGLGLFALSPLPSAQLFVVAGLVGAPLVPLTAAFFAGRLVSYKIYVTAASAAKQSLGSIVQSSFTSPFGIALQLLMLAGLVALLRVNWAQILTGHRALRDRGRQPREPAPQVSRDARPHARQTQAHAAGAVGPTDSGSLDRATSMSAPARVRGRVDGVS